MLRLAVREFATVTLLDQCTTRCRVLQHHNHPRDRVLGRSPESAFGRVTEAPADRAAEVPVGRVPGVSESSRPRGLPTQH